MKSLWKDNQAQKCKNPLELRAYTSRLLGQNEDLVLHGGGNTSVKTMEKDIFGQEVEVLYVKGSGYDLKTIPPTGFSQFYNTKFNNLDELPELSDMDMVRELKTSLLNPAAPNPSVETILHGIIPFQYVDHTHADAVVAISNTPDGQEILRKIYGDKILFIPYTMPGFILSKVVYNMTKDINWNELEGMILLNHGVFTFDNDAKNAYEKMISIVSRAEEYLEENDLFEKKILGELEDFDPKVLASIRRKASNEIGKPTIVSLNSKKESVGFSNLENAAKLINKGTLTPDHIIHTKRTGFFIEGSDYNSAFENFKNDYQRYYERNTFSGLTILDRVPRYGLWKGKGLITIGPNKKRANVVSDILDHTLKSILWSEGLGGHTPLPEKDLFEVEYWELEQAKLKKITSTPQFEGQVVFVTGAASGIGLACVKEFLEQGACVIGVDLNPEVENLLQGVNSVGLVCDVTDTQSIQDAVKAGIKNFGGIDVLVSNAGTFPKSAKIETLNDKLWEKTIDVNLSSHFKVLREVTPYLKLGWKSSVIFIASKNVPAPGPGAAAYSVSKAGLTQLARVAALELGQFGIRVNTLHPNAVFDTGVWTKEILESRAKNYGLSVEEYKKNNVLKTEVTSQNVAQLARLFASSELSKTTGAQVPVDGGNERVI